jgi:hypothetical protein
VQITRPQLLVTIALLVDAVTGHYLYRQGLADMSDQPLYAAWALALIVAALAVHLLLHPRPWALLLARGVAGTMLLAVLALSFLLAIGAGFTSYSSQEATWTLAAILGLVAVQLAVVLGCARIEAVSFQESVTAMPKGTLLFWLILAAVTVITSILEPFLALLAA